jgi:transposase
MAMGFERSGVETLLLQMVCLDDLVAADDRYRGIERVVSWRAVRASAAPFYAPDGPYSVCPAVLMKLFLVAAVEGVSSMRETLRLAGRDIAIRRFLGYGLTERLPSHATVSYAQCVRFAESSIFEQLFVQVLAQCREAGLLDGTRLLVDATHVEANAALASLRAELSVVEAAAGGADDGDDDDSPPAGGEPRLVLAEPRSGPTPRRVSSNRTSVSLSDPDAKLRHKPGQAYASAETYQTLDELRVVAYIPPQRRMLGTEALAARARTRTARGVSVKIDRMTHAEGAIGELENQHALGHIRSRGTGKTQIQLLLAATAVNLKTARPLRPRPHRNGRRRPQSAHTPRRNG